MDHKKRCNNGYTLKLYNTIRENGGWDNWRMVIIEDCGEITLTETRIKEEEHRVKLNGNLNMIKCHQTEEGKKIILNKYREENRERIKTNILNWRKQIKVCECGKEYTNGHKKRHEQTLIHKKLIEEKNNI